MAKLTMESGFRKSTKQNGVVTVVNAEKFEWKKDGETVQPNQPTMKFTTLGGDTFTVPVAGIRRMPTSFFGGIKASVVYDVNEEKGKVYYRTIDFEGAMVANTVSKSDLLNDLLH